MVVPTDTLPVGMPCLIPEPRGAAVEVYVYFNLTGSI